jgi:hypothetical protein
LPQRVHNCVHLVVRDFVKVVGGSITPTE